jgi:predicted ATPase with chaperone activity
MSQLNFSARAYHRILKPARTIADLARYEKFNLLIWQKLCMIRSLPKLLIG